MGYKKNSNLSGKLADELKKSIVISIEPEFSIKKISLQEQR